MPICVNDFIDRLPADTEALVDQTRQRIANKLRESVRKATGLSLSRSSGNHSLEYALEPDNIVVPIELKAGMPTSISDITFDDRLWLLPLVSPYRNELENGSRGLSSLNDLIRRISQDPRADLFLRDDHKDQILSLQQIMSYFLGVLEDANPVQKILEVNQDVLGVYKFYPGHRNDSNYWHGNVEIYWGVIGLIARLLGVSIDSLTCVVLAHELAHAYTHLGADIDGQRWDTIEFCNCEHALAEGLAQYYTYLICRGMENHASGAFDAYQSLLSKQPPAYHTHEDWIEKYTPEIMRMGLIEARRRKIIKLDVFNSLLVSAKERLN